MKMPSFYDWASPPIEGYEQVRVRALLNPSKAVYADYLAGGTEPTSGERQLLTLNQEVLHISGISDEERCAAEQRIAEIEQALVERRQRLGRAFHALYGETPTATLDFSSPDAALATIEDRELPEEVLFWLFQLPAQIVARRQELIAKKLAESFDTIPD